MANNNLIVEVSEQLLEAMELPTGTGKLDYFAFLGIERDASKAEIGKAVMSRSKALRPWQNSPKHGEETVKLLPMLHRVAKVLKDAARREAYIGELDRMLRGEKADPMVEFQKMVAAAASGGGIDEKSRTELRRFAQGSGIASDQAEGILAKHAVADVTASVAQAAMVDDWAEPLAQGTQPLEVLGGFVSGMLGSNAYNRDRRKELVGQAVAHGAAEAEAGKVCDDLCSKWFRSMVGAVAAGGVLSDNQARLLMPKALIVGIDPDAAYEILSDFTFTRASRKDLANRQLTMPSFDASEIENLLSEQQTVHYVQKNGIIQKLAGLARNPKALVAMAVVVCAIGAATVMMKPSEKRSRRRSSIGTAPVKTADAAAPVEDQSEERWNNPLPDPSNGMLSVTNENGDGSAGYSISISEVTCYEYAQFINDTFYPQAPEGWGADYKYPEGKDAHPVTGIRWKDAVAFCKWKARQLGVAEDLVRLPRIEEIRHILKFPSTKGMKATESQFFGDSGISKLISIGPSGLNRETDVVHLPKGQVYDLIVNAREWAMDEKGGKTAVYGWQVGTGKKLGDPGDPEFIEPEKSFSNVGFRCVMEERKS